MASISEDNGEETPLQVWSSFFFSPVIDSISSPIPFHSWWILIGAFKWCGNFNWYCWTHSSPCCFDCAPHKVNQSLANYVCPWIGDSCLTFCFGFLFYQTNLSRYFTGHTKNPDGSRQFIAGQTKVGRAVDGAIKIVTIAVCVNLKCLEDWLKDDDDYTS